MADAIQMRRAHFPGRAPIDAYGNGGFRFADMSHRGSIICLPSGIYGVNMADNMPTVHDIDLILTESQDVEILIIGTGDKHVLLPQPLRVTLRQHHIAADTMTTGAGVRTFNVLLAEDRAVAAILFAV